MGESHNNRLVNKINWFLCLSFCISLYLLPSAFFEFRVWCGCERESQHNELVNKLQLELSNSADFFVCCFAFSLIFFLQLNLKFGVCECEWVIGTTIWSISCTCSLPLYWQQSHTQQVEHNYPTSKIPNSKYVGARYFCTFLIEPKISQFWLLGKVK